MEQMVDMIIDAYVKVYGAERWNSLTAEEQHTVIMKIAKDLDKMI